MTSSSSPDAPFGSPCSVYDMSIRPAIPEHAPAAAKTNTFTLSTATPQRRAVSGLEPTA